MFLEVFEPGLCEVFFVVGGEICHVLVSIRPFLAFCYHQSPLLFLFLFSFAIFKFLSFPISNKGRCSIGYDEVVGSDRHLGRVNSEEFS